MDYLVIANGEEPSEHLLISLLKEQRQLVAVDGGFYTCLKYGLEPQILMGDFDSVIESVRKKFSHITQLYMPDQNKSDLEKALNYLFDDLGAATITVCGATGKRLDHTLTNICLLSRFPEKVKFETDTEICISLPKSIKLTCHVGQTLSLIPLSTSVQKVFTKGLRWELTGQNLSKAFIGISNVCLQTEISITFEEGDLIVCLNRNFSQ